MIRVFKFFHYETFFHSQLRITTTFLHFFAASSCLCCFFYFCDSKQTFFSVSNFYSNEGNVKVKKNPHEWNELLSKRVCNISPYGTISFDSFDDCSSVNSSLCSQQANHRKDLWIAYHKSGQRVYRTMANSHKMLSFFRSLHNLSLTESPHNLSFHRL